MSMKFFQEYRNIRNLHPQKVPARHKISGRGSVVLVPSESEERWRNVDKPNIEQEEELPVRRITNLLDLLCSEPQA